MIEIGIGIIIGLAVALIIWKLMPRNETKDDTQSDELKNAEINLARREAELIAANEAKTNLENQIKRRENLSRPREQG